MIFREWPGPTLFFLLPAFPALWCTLELSTPWVLTPVFTPSWVPKTFFAFASAIASHVHRTDESFVGANRFTAAEHAVIAHILFGPSPFALTFPVCSWH